ncbi:hypothetical protein ACJIZ3_006490 [Penstemon smallii]|uniref:Uncharacterized protein n=1 Tax=Penstemon smallii TaxID=265156 RepID=A0ABD3S858_9LAMI
MVIMTTNSIENRSTLELMLDKIQNLDREHQTTYVPPSLPVRPLSRARLPPRSRRPLALDLDKKIISSEAKGIFQEASSDIFLKGIEVSKNSKSEKGISNIQNCYRGHQIRCYYKDLKRVVITLQSFARGQNARRDYECRIKRLRAILTIQKHTKKYVERRLRQMHYNKTMHEPKSRQNITTQDNTAKDYIQVPFSVIINLQKQVLKTEAKVREKKEENNALKIRIEEMDKKWHKSEERMKSMEKTWQDQLTYIQKCLAASKKKPAPIIAIEQFDYTEEQNNYQNLDSNVLITEIGCEQVSNNKLCPEEELGKLKVRFKAWKKGYRNKIKEAQSTFKKIGHFETSAKSYRNWWGRFSH